MDSDGRCGRLRGGWVVGGGWGIYGDVVGSLVCHGDRLWGHGTDIRSRRGPLVEEWKVGKARRCEIGTKARREELERKSFDVAQVRASGLASGREVGGVGQASLVVGEQDGTVIRSWTDDHGAAALAFVSEGEVTRYSEGQFGAGHGWHIDDGFLPS